MNRTASKPLVVAVLASLLCASSLLSAEDFNEDVEYVRGLLEMGLVDRATEVWDQLEPRSPDQENTQTKLSIEILQTRWGYEPNPAKRQDIFEDIKKQWQGYLTSHPGDDDGAFQYISLLNRHARTSQDSAQQNPSQAKMLLAAAADDSVQAKALVEKLIEAARNKTTELLENEALLKARYYDIEIGYYHGLCFPDDKEKMLEIYKPFIEAPETKIELFVWDYEDFITAYFALALGGQMKMALGRFASAVNDLRGILEIPLEGTTSLRLRAYALLGEALVQSGAGREAIDYADRMISEYANVWGQYHGEVTLVWKARALSNLGDPAGAVELLSEVIEREGPGKGMAQEALDVVRQQNPDGIQLSCEVLYRASQGSIRRAGTSEREDDWFRALRSLHDAVAACLTEPEDLRKYGIDALMDLGHSFAQLDRHYVAALTYERGRELAHQHWGESNWPEDADAADFAYYSYLQWKNVENNNKSFAGRGQEARNQLARFYPDSDQVKELVYYIGRELQLDARALARTDIAASIAKHKEARTKFAEVGKSSRKFETALFLSARSAYDIVGLEFRRAGLKEGVDDPTPGIVASYKAALDSFQTYEDYVAAQPADFRESVLKEREYNARWMAFYRGRLAAAQKDFDGAVANLLKAEAPQDPEFRAKRDYYVIDALLEADKVGDAEKLYGSMKIEFGSEHPMVSKSALALAKHLDQAYLVLDKAGKEAEARDAELRSAVYFYEFAQSGKATASNLLNIGRKFYKVAGDFWENGEGDKANAEYDRAVWCFDRYLEKETDAKKRAEIEEDRAFILWFLGRDAEAMEWLEPAAKKYPRRADISERLAWCYVGLENYELAQDEFGRLITGLGPGSATWLVARYGLAYCMAKKIPSPDDVKAANAKGMKPGEYLGQRGLDMIKDMRELFDISKHPETKKPLRIRDPDDPKRRVREIENLWRNVEIDLRKRK